MKVKDRNRERSPLLDLKNNIDYKLMEMVESLTTPSDKILDISCGNGSDSFELIKRGYDVCSTENNQGYYNHVSKKMDCIKHDTRNKFPYKDNEFDLVYCRLGLHYFSQEELVGIFDEISRITSDHLIFLVKIRQDSLATGKVMISKEVWDELTSKNFNILSSVTHEGQLYQHESEWLEVTAEKIY
tara:strand:+ start:12708 stop:13265 length:558 start_codon:yes stop_codon:yes gene_type:complete